MLKRYQKNIVRYLVHICVLHLHKPAGSTNWIRFIWGAPSDLRGGGGGGGQFFCAGFSFWWALAFGAASFFLANAGIFLSGRILHDFLFLAY